MPSYKAITMESLVDDRITASAVEKNEASEPKKPGQYRVRSGFYLGVASQTWLRQVETGPQEGRQYMSILFKLYDKKTEKFRGTVFADVSWTVFEINGSRDAKSRLFSDLMAAMGVPAKASLQRVLPSVVDTAYELQVSEYFNVNHEDLIEGELVEKLKEQGRYQAGRRDRHYIKDGKAGDSVAEQYLADGYKSQGLVKSIHKYVPDTSDDVPF